MNTSKVQPPNADERLWTLVAALCDGEISDAERRELETLLIEDESARLFYAAYTDLHGRLLWRFRGEQSDAGARRPAVSGRIEDGDECKVEWEGINLQISEAPNLHISVRHSPLSTLNSAWAFSYSVATLFLAVVLLGAWSYTIVHPDADSLAVKNSRGATPPSGRIEKETPQFTLVGRVGGMVDCRWSDPATETYPGAGVTLGRRYALESGLMEISYESGAKVILQGPCDYKVESAHGGFLKVGKLVARVGAGDAGHGTGDTTNLPSPFGRGAGGEGSRPRSQPALTLALSQRERGPEPEPQNPKSPTPHSPLPSPLFAIRTPTALVEDLGTEFGVEVAESGETVSHVFQGRVVVRVEGAGVGGRGTGIENQNSAIQHPISEAVILSAGQSARVERPAADGPPVLRRGEPSGGMFVREMPRRVPIKLFNTGLGLKEGDADPHWQVVARSDDPQFKPQQAVVTASHYFWMSNSPGFSQWISLENGPPELPDAVTYTFRTTFELPSPPEGAVIRCRFIVDNHVRAIRLNGRELSVPEHPYENYREFTEMKIDEGFVAGENVLEFEVSNGREKPELGELSGLGLRVELQGSVIQRAESSLKKQSVMQSNQERINQ
jgi:hypothetical protein